MTRRPFLRAVAAAALSVSFAQPALAQAQAFPTKPLRFVVPFPAGSATDNVARIVAQAMGEAAGPVGGGGEQARRQRHPGRRAGEVGTRRRLHDAGHHQHHPGRQCEPVQEAALRPGQGLHPDRQDRPDRLRADGAARLPGGQPASEFLDLWQGQSRQAQRSATDRPARWCRARCSNKMGGIEAHVGGLQGHSARADRPDRRLASSTRSPMSAMRSRR
jgi:hypothetical protein